MIRTDIGQQQFNRSIDLSAGEHTKVEFSLEGKARIHGKISGPAMGTGRPVYTLSLTSEGEQEYASFSTLSDMDSNYVLAGLPPGSWVVHLEANSQEAGISISKAVDLVAGGNVELNFEVVLAGLEGSVTSSDGQKLPGALIWAAPWTDGMFIPGSRSRISRLREHATESGEYSLLGMKPGRYVYTVELDGYGLEQGLIEIPDEETILQKNFTLEPEARLEVTLCDRNGSEINEANCLIRRSDAYSILPLARLDEYLPDRRVFSGATTGIYTIRVEAEGFFPAEAEAECRSGKTTSTSVTLRRPGSLSLRIISPEGMTIPDFPLQILDMETGTDVTQWLEQGLVVSSTSATATDDVGELTLQNLPEGAFRIRSQDLFATITVSAGTLTGPEVIQQSR